MGAIPLGKALSGGTFLQILKVERDNPGLPCPNECTVILSDKAPPTALVTSAFALAFDGERLLCANLVERGLDIPGGHIEPGESPEQAAKREVFEETGAQVIGLRLVGYVRIRILSSKPATHKYPYPDSFMVFYGARIAGFEELTPDRETLRRALLRPNEAREVPAIKGLAGLYEVALTLMTTPA